MSSKQPKWSIEHKTRIVLSVLRGEVAIAEANRQHAVSQTSIAKWRDAFLDGGQTAEIGLVSVFV
jgi:transposase